METFSNPQRNQANPPPQKKIKKKGDFITSRDKTTHTPTPI